MVVSECGDKVDSGSVAAAGCCCCWLLLLLAAAAAGCCCCQLFQRVAFMLVADSASHFGRATLRIVFSLTQLCYIAAALRIAHRLCYHTRLNHPLPSARRCHSSSSHTHTYSRPHSLPLTYGISLPPFHVTAFHGVHIPLSTIAPSGPASITHAKTAAVPISHSQPSSLTGHHWSFTSDAAMHMMLS